MNWLISRGVLKFDAMAGDAQPLHTHSFPWLQGKAGIGSMHMSSATLHRYHPPSQPSLQDAPSDASEGRSASAAYTPRNPRLTPVIAEEGVDVRRPRVFEICAARGKHLEVQHTSSTGAAYGGFIACRPRRCLIYTYLSYDYCKRRA